MAYGVATGRKAADGQAHLPFPVIVRVRVAPRAVHHLDGRQQRVHAARHDALGGAAAAHDGDAAQPVVHAASQYADAYKEVNIKGLDGTEQD